jgi:hypothetical protein
LINVPDRIARSARRITRHLPTAWPWTEDWPDLFATVHAPPHGNPSDSRRHYPDNTTTTSAWATSAAAAATNRDLPTPASPTTGDRRGCRPAAQNGRHHAQLIGPTR